MYALAEKSVELNKPRIFVVDDEPEILDFLKYMLEQSGNDVFPFTNGAAALEAIELDHPDIILLDITMPGMDGFQVCEKIKQNPKNKDIPVIFLSALISTENKIQGFHAGGIDYITKPYQPDEVQARVATHIKLGREEVLLRHQNDYLEQTVLERTVELRLDIEGRILVETQLALPDRGYRRGLPLYHLCPCEGGRGE